MSRQIEQALTRQNASPFAHVISMIVKIGQMERQGASVGGRD